MLRLALAQVNPTVGALRENREILEQSLTAARSAGARVVLFPELALTGYPPEDLLSNPGFVREARKELLRLLPHTQGLLAMIGLPLHSGTALYNAAAVVLDGRWIDSYAKNALPNYGVFDEKRYFRPGLRCPVYHWHGFIFGLNICEDLWTPQGVPDVQSNGGARLLFNLSSSPFHAGKGRLRERLLCHRARQHRAAIVCCNLVGGQDELVFDGESLVVDAAGRVRGRGARFREDLLIVDLADDWLDPAPAAAAEEAFEEPLSEPMDELEERLWLEVVPLEARPAGAAPAASVDPLPTSPAVDKAAPAPRPEHVVADPRPEDPESEIYEALCCGTRDYAEKNGFRNVVIGLSGGIDSALAAVIAADALGPDRVLGVSMPSRYNSASSRQGARDLAGNLGISFLEIPIEEPYQALLGTLAPHFAGLAANEAEENLQSRIRGMILMALSNKWGHLVLTTGNKSELAVGYCTLYGDMAGGFAVIKDVPKTMVYRLARRRNERAPVIPQDTMTRPPSAELRENQTDQDRLPPYELLDQIIEARLEEEADPRVLVERGLDEHWVRTVYRWIDANEYKRRQAPPGIKITPRAFGRDRRYPITNRYRGPIEADEGLDASRRRPADDPPAASNHPPKAGS